MAWRLAQSLEVLRAEINEVWPQRSKRMDGTIGDPAHAARGKASDHNPWVKDASGKGVVTAIDIDDNGGELDALAEHFRAGALAGDRRIKYVICNGRIASATGSWAWREYKGPNRHDKHIHLSVSPDLRLADSREPWKVARIRHGAAKSVGTPAPRATATPRFVRELRAPLRDNEVVRTWQQQMKKRGWKLTVDGHYGEADVEVTKAFQRQKGLNPDGVVGPITWAAAWNLPIT